MSIFSQFQTDTEMEREGVVLEYDDVKLLVARAGGENKKFRRIFDQKMKPYQRQVQNESLSEDVAGRLLREAYAEGVVLGAEAKDKNGKWHSGKLPNPDGKGGLVEFTAANLVKLFEALPEWFADIQVMSSKFATFRREVEEEDEKNSSES